VVGYEGDRSFVHVEEGEVAAFRVASMDAFPVRTGETFWLAPSPSPAPSPAPSPSPSASSMDIPVPPSPVEGEACEGRIATARKAMRADKPQKALAVIEAALAAGDARMPTRCQDELGYLRAEALRQSGETAQAITAFKSLDRPRATKAMRQNALYAAGQLEARRGNQAQAGRLFDRAYSSYPDGALAEESLAGLLEAQARAGAGAQGTARRYLDRFPSGMAAARARGILSAPLPPTR
jgi:TolA-binding protein